MFELRGAAARQRGSLAAPQPTKSLHKPARDASQGIFKIFPDIFLTFDALWLPKWSKTASKIDPKSIRNRQKLDDNSRTIFSSIFDQNVHGFKDLPNLENH